MAVVILDTVPDTDFDLSWHVRQVALPASADISAVLDFAHIEAMTAFDPSRTEPA